MNGFAEYFGVSTGSGVLVLQASGTGLHRLQAGDVIRAMNNVPTGTVAALARRWETSLGSQEATLRVVRDGRNRDVRVQMQEAAEVVSLPDVARRYDDSTARSDPGAWDQLLGEISQLRARLQALEAQVDEQVRR
jgi:hypothetical protein